MNNEEFKQKLSAVAEWRIPKSEQETSLNAKKKRGRKSNEDQYMELREEIFHKEFEGVNPTYPPMLVRVKCSTTACEDCGRTCEGGRQKEKKLYEANKIRHWREKCVTCNKFQNPYTGAFDLSPGDSSIKWNSFLRDSKGSYRSKGNLAKDKFISQIPLDKTEQDK